jgi:hypothetical protein
LEKLVSRTKRNQRKVLRSVCGPRRSGYPCAAGDARSLYGMRCICAMRRPLRTGCICAMRSGCDARTSADWLHLRDALRGRCTGCDALRGRCTGCDALRGRCTGCDARTSADWLHLRDALRGRCICAVRAGYICKRRRPHAFDGGILRVVFLGSVQH